MSIEFIWVIWGIAATLIIPLAVWGLDRMLKPKNRTAPIALLCLAGVILLAPLIYSLLYISNSWLAAILLWCLAAVLLAAFSIYLIYWLLRKRKLQKVMPMWLHWIIVVILFLGFVVPAVYGSLIMKTYPQIETSKPTFIPRPINTSAQNMQLSHPSPREIFDYINSLHSYDQQQAKKNYEGRTVTWAVRFIKIEPAFLVEGQQVQSRSVEGDYSPFVFFLIDINDYIEFRTMATGQEFIVQGTITQVGDGWINLDKCCLFFY
jgi:hypothetical protein